MKSDLEFSERLIKLRTTASALYEVGTRSGQTQQEIQKSIEPVTQVLHKSILEAVRNDLAGIAVACRRLESEARCHETDMKFLMTKAGDARYHSELLKKAVIGRMKELGVTELHDRDFMATLTVHDGKEIITFR